MRHYLISSVDIARVYGMQLNLITRGKAGRRIARRRQTHALCTWADRRIRARVAQIEIPRRPRARARVLHYANLGGV